MSPEFRLVFLGREVHPLDVLRKRQAQADELDVTSDEEARRGDEIEVLVTISSLQGLQDLAAGLVCTEYYLGAGPSSENSSATYDAIAHESWASLEAAVGVQSVRFTIPPDAPFSHAGECLSFNWEVVARGRRARGPDARATREISVLP